MSKKFKSQASSARAASTLTGGFGFGATFQSLSSPLSYVTEAPDLSQISESNVVVAFKNLGKKDSTTKAKALEELQEICNGEVEQAVLQAWADIYPRTSIDNSRRVRQLAHTLQGSLTSSAGKRIVPLLPKVIGPWLAGTFDSDKSASRCAQEALAHSFNTPAKRKALWNLYRSSLFEFVEDAIIVQTTATLSDERSTSTDDAEAKYVRVVGTAMGILAQLLRNEAQNDLVPVLLGGKKLWEFAYHSDPYLRRTACDLVLIASSGYQKDLKWDTISNCFVSKGLHASQTGSSRQFTGSLVALTQQRPEIWTTDYTGKTAASKRLIQFLKRGSQSGPEDVWSTISKLVTLIPQEVSIGDNLDGGATALAEALRTGVTQPAERANATAAWAAYVESCLWLSRKLSNGQPGFVNRQLVPIVKQYVTKREEQQWNITIRAIQVCQSVVIGVIQLGALATFEAMWADLSSAIIIDMRLSQPETSKDFRSSQDAVIEQAKRLFTIKLEILKATEDSRILSTFQRTDNEMLDAAMQLLRTRNGKPYSAAGVMELIVFQAGFDSKDHAIQNFLQADLPPLLNSPSAEILVSVALQCGQIDIINQLFSERSENARRATNRLLTAVKPSNLTQDSMDKVVSGDLNDTFDRNAIIAVLQNPHLSALHSDICRRIQQLTDANSSVESQQAAIALLEDVAKDSMSMKPLTSDGFRPMLLPNLLAMADSESGISERVSTILHKFNGQSGSSTGSAFVVQQQLNGEGTPLSIFMLVDLAIGIVRDDAANLQAVLPTPEIWAAALSSHLSSARPYSLSITSPLQGLIYKIDATKAKTEDSQMRDQDDFSLAFRLLLYVTKLLTSDSTSQIGVDNLESQYSYYPIALQLVNEKLTLEDANNIWVQATPEVLQEAADVLSEGNKLIQSWLMNDGFLSYWLKIGHGLNDTDMPSYLTALAFSNIAMLHIDQQGSSKLLMEYENEIKTVTKSQQNIVRSAALLAVTRDSLTLTQPGKRVLNELVASTTELRGSNFEPLLLLNILLQDDPQLLDTIPSQRIVFLLQNLIRLFEDENIAGVQSEVMKLMVSLVPQLQDIYGDYWDAMVNDVVQTWSAESDLPSINSAVRLYSRLKTMSRDVDVNEDLQQAFKSEKTRLDSGLVDCLQQLGQTKTGADQPRTITAELIRRQLYDVEVKNDADLFGLLSSHVEAIQTASYELLHRTIPEQQEQLSVEMLLENRIIQLPQELMHLLADGATNARCYLLVWKLIFDHFEKASYRLQEAYTASIKASGHIDEFFNYACEILRITGGRPVDASKFDIDNFKPEEAESVEKELQWLVVHNYYNALLHVPSLAKDWFISQKNRVKSPLESWTQKHISPLIVSASLSTVTDWAATQSQEEDDRSLTIKSSPRGSELTAAIAVDPESPPISLAISLPSSYPLESPVVSSRTRVGVSEKNWQSWLRTIQIIIFSTGSIIEGLVAFRRNVQGALKGQSECAICYSIIGTDMQTPNKKCGTCKNNFHGTCLFRWFKSSNSSSCPLCRNNFNYA